MSKYFNPSIDSNGAGSVCARFNSLAATLYKVSFISVDLPDPDTPVIQVNTPTGISKLTLFRLLPYAELILSQLLDVFRLLGTKIFSRPLIYSPVNDFGLLLISLGAPTATISPPCSPAPGPMSIT